MCVIKCVIYSNSYNGDSYNNNSYYCNINNNENNARDGVYLGPSLIEHFLEGFCAQIALLNAMEGKRDIVMGMARDVVWDMLWGMEWNVLRVNAE